MILETKRFGEMLEEFRKHKNLKQEDIAEIVGTTASRISRIERSVADAEMSYIELHRLIKYFALSPKALMLRCEFVEQKNEIGLATKLMRLLDEIKRESEEEREI